MNNEEKRIKIAEACGWEIAYQNNSVPHYWEIFKPDKSVRLPYYKTKEAAFILGTPDYFNDLNACHEMEEALTYDQSLDFMVKLCHIVGLSGEGKRWWDLECHEAWRTSHATAAQRAEAFGLTLGLWKP